MQKTLVLAGLLIMATCLQASTIEINSPNVPLNIELNNNEEQPHYTKPLFQKTVIKPSKLDLTSLGTKKKHEITTYRDDKDASWRSNPYALDINSHIVDKQDTLSVYLASGGGFAARIEEVEQ